jgi:hypothetical protein
MHPLNPRARWLILPGLSIALGWGLTFALVLIGYETPGYGLLGGALTGAAALATALSAKPWVGYLAAPPLGVIFFAGAYFAAEGQPPSTFLPIMLESPGLLFVIAMVTAPVAVLHGIRMRRPSSWALVGLGFYTLAGVGAALAQSLVSGDWNGSMFMTSLSFNVGLYLANGAALEVALRMSPKR